MRIKYVWQKYMKITRYLFPLLIISSLSAFSEARITGAFWQLNGGNINKSRAHWATELDLMKRAGMDTVIIQYSATDSSRFFGSSAKSNYYFQGPFKAGVVEIVINKGPIIVYEIQTDATFTYELDGALPSVIFGDDGEKLKDSFTDNLDTAVVWGEDAIEPIIIKVNLENDTDSITIIAGKLTDNASLPKAEEVKIGNNASTIKLEDDYSFLLDEAQKRDMKVWLGLKLSDQWWSGKLDLNKDLKENILLAEELLSLYGSYSSFYGFYIPHELYPSGPSLPKNYMDFFRDLTIGLQKLDKPVSIAPYFGGNMMPRSHGNYWEAFFKEVPLDVLMLQDGVGCHRLPLAQIPRYYKEVYEVCKKYGVEFWSDLEVFNQLPGEVFNAEPADFARVKEQVITQSPTVDKIVIFDWPHYMSPNRNSKAKALYDEYVAWIESEE